MVHTEFEACLRLQVLGYLYRPFLEVLLLKAQRPPAPQGTTWWWLPEQQGHTSSEVHPWSDGTHPGEETRRTALLEGEDSAEIFSRRVTIWGSHFRHTVYPSESH